VAVSFINTPPKDNVTCSKTVSFTEVNAIIEERCISCNSFKRPLKQNTKKHIPQE
jgi:hypothetical protein